MSLFLMPGVGLFFQIEPSSFHLMGKKEIYEVEDILDHKNQKNKTLYLIKWRGYSIEESTWEPEFHLNCPAIIAKYNSRLESQKLIDHAIYTSDNVDIKRNEENRIITAKSNSNIHSSRIFTSPISSSMSPSHHFDFQPSSSRDLSPLRIYNKPGGISNFFKPTAVTLPVEDSSSYSQICKNDWIYVDSDQEEKDDIDSFNDSMKKFQKMLSRVPGPPISIRNDFDRTSPPSHFIYINETLYGPGVSKPDASFLVGCSCYVIDQNHETNKSRDGCCLHRECECIAQNPDGSPAYDSDGLLLPCTSVIYECNKKCCCSIFNQPCKNRVIQMGRQVSLTIIRLPDQRGWGVIANHDIPRGSFVDLYLGEVISTKEATKRFISDSQGSDSEIGSYLFDLDFNYEFGTECEFTLDAYRYGNVSHFFNHSCSPNLKVFPCFIEHLDPRLHSIAFFTCRPISKGEQLTFDYMGLQDRNHRETRVNNPKRTRKSSIDDDDDLETHSNRDLNFEEITPDSRRSSSGGIKRNQKNKPIKCLCGSSNCRKFIYI